MNVGELAIRVISGFLSGCGGKSLAVMLPTESFLVIIVY